METTSPDIKLELARKQTERSRVFLLWLGIGSMAMTFAGLTSAFIVREGQRNWFEFSMPPVFWYSTVVLLLSSVLMNFALQQARKNEGKKAGMFLLGVLGMAAVFAVLQIYGWKTMIDGGLYFSDRKNVSGSFFYTITCLHFVHLLAGVITVMVSAVRAFAGKYSAQNHLGMKLTAYFWHFLDLLWLYLFIFLTIKTSA
ncbi:MAG: cytochrome c oxidase subunit 3 [Flavobacteriales bacterium]